MQHVGEFIMKPTPFSIVFAMLALSFGVIALSQIYFQNQQTASQYKPKDSVHYSKNKVVADVIGDDRVVWAEEKSALKRWRLYSQLGSPFNILSGLLEIQFDDGSNVLLEGPTQFKVESKSGRSIDLWVGCEQLS